MDIHSGLSGGPKTVGTTERSELIAEIQDLYVGHGDAEALLTAFRAAAVYVPLWGPEAMWSGEAEGVRWLYAFTSEGELERFMRAQAAQAPSRAPGGSVSYWTVFGARLLDVAVPEMTAQTQIPSGVALDVAGGRPLCLPPVARIVPDAVAVDVAAAAAPGGGESR